MSQHHRAFPRPPLPPLNIVWFKRDLRVSDHRPLAEAARLGAVLPLYIIEPSLLHAPDYDPCHWTFIRASLQELRDQLAALGQPLVVRVGEAAEVLEGLRQQFPVAGLWSHEETGSVLTRTRDATVGRWACDHGIPFIEYPQSGVVRPLRDRDNWAGFWEARMRQPLAPDVSRLVPLPAIEPGALPTHAELGLSADVRTEAQPGGEWAARDLLDSFLAERGRGYQRAMGSPTTSEWTCSRLSPHLAFGTLSLKTAYQAALSRADEARAVGDAAWSRAMFSFTERLHWHSHFMQKLEDEPRIEFESFVPAYDALRADFDPAHLDAWTHGQTGYPLVDACMRALMVTGWLNFRMRAMIVSFAAYDLFLPWQPLALARPCVWLDFEPGIHYGQFQMQSGTTGINTMRVYNPVKQSYDQDPDGVFIRRYVPELAAVPTSFLHAPWLMPTDMQRQLGCVIGRTYPRPIVEHDSAARTAKERLWELRRDPAVQAAAAAVLERHGSRRANPRDRRTAQPSLIARPPRARRPTPESVGQLALL